MKNVRKSLVLITLILFSALSLLAGCNDNIYKNLKLSLSTSAPNGVVTLSDNVQDNVFTITATTTGMPKGYDGAVAFSVPVNDSIELTQGATKISNGVYYGTFYAKEPGTVNVSVVTLEGNVSSEITIKVVKEISGLNFNDTLIPVVKGVETDISQFLNYYPQNTNQTEVELELIKQGENDELIKIIRNGSKITVPNDCNVTDFEVVAKSIYNDRIFARTQAKVISLVATEQLSVKHDVGVIGDTSDDKVLTYSRGEYFLELASNTSDLHEKIIYVDFLNPADAENYVVSVVGLNEEGLIVENGIKKGVVQIDIDKATGVLTVKAIGLGTDKLILNVSRRDFPNYTQFTRQLIVNVNVLAYPTSITVTDGNKELNELVIYANYDSVLFGAPVKFDVYNEFGLMSNEDVILSLSGYEDRIELYDRWRNQLQFNESVSANYTYYLKHNLTTVPSDLTLTITSVKYNKVVKTIPIKIVTQGIDLTTDVGAKEGELSLDINVTDPTVVGISGLPNGYDYRNLTVDYDENMLNLTQTNARISISPKNQIGKTNLTITAPNGSRVRYVISLYESLELESTNLKIAGQIISPYELTNSDPINVTVKNNLVLPIMFTVNGKEYSALPDVLDYSADSENRDVVRVATGYKLATQNISGSSLITIRITGYDNFGSKTRVATFRIRISVHIPLSEISVAKREVTIYDYNEINIEQKQLYGTHKIVLNTQPSYATYTFEDLEWLVNFNGISYNLKQLAELTVNGDVYTYVLRTSNVTTITLVTNINNFTEATVYCSLGSTSSASFTVSARIKQSFINESGILIDATKQIDIKFEVIKPIAVEYFVFDNVETKVVNNYAREYFVTFDERELGYTDSGYTTNNVREINFQVYPQNALYKDLDVRCSVPGAIEVKINNTTGVLTITAKNKILSEYGTALITVWAKDSVNVVGGMGDLYTEITVRILNGTKFAPFEITNTNDLLKINQSMNAYFVLADNISVGEWQPIGYTNHDLVVPFTGYLSGKNKTYDVNGNVLEERQYYLSNLQVTGSYSYMGLFAMLGRNGVLEDIVINGVYINNPAIVDSLNYYVGSLVGYSEGVIKNVTISDLSGVDNFNGAYFDNLDTTIIQNRGISISPSVSMQGKQNVFVGGVVGFVNNPTLNEFGSTAGRLSTANENIGSYSYTNAEILLQKATQETKPQIVDVNVSIEINVDAKGSVAYVGGIAGFNNKAIITKTLNDISGSGISQADVVVCINSRVINERNDNSAFGGAVGFNNGEINNYTIKALIPSNKAIESSKALNNVGGVVGYNAGVIENNISNPLVRGNNNVGGLVGVSENTVVNFVTSKYNFINGIDLANNSALVEFNKNLQIEYVNYSNIMARVNRDDYNNDELTLYDIFAKEFNVSLSDSIEDLGNRELFNQFVNYYLAGNQGKNREHMVILKVENTNLNSGVSPSVTYVYKSNVNAGNYSLEKSGSNITINTTKEIVSVQEVIETLNNAKINYVTGNNVELLETEKLADYKTGVLGYNNVGGLIGKYSGLYYQTPADNEEDTATGILNKNLIFAVDADTGRKPLSSNMKIEFVNTLEYNSVYSYYLDSTLIDKWNTNVSSTNEYFGDIVLEKALNNSNKYNVGGLIGESNNAYIQYNSVNAGVAANNANIGGLVGSASNVIQIADSYFAGAILNSPESQTEAERLSRGTLIGSAQNAQQTGLNYGEWMDINSNNVIDSNDRVTHYYAPYAVTSKYTNKEYFNNIVNSYFFGNYNNEDGIEVVGNNKSSKNYYKMLDNHIDPNALLKFVVDESQPVYNVSYQNENYLYFGYETGYSIMGMFKTTTSGSVIPDAVWGKIKLYEKVLTLSDPSDFYPDTDKNSSVRQSFNPYEITVDADLNGINDIDQSNGFDDAYSRLSNYSWYGYADINNGLPVLLSRQRIRKTDEYNFAIKLLVNFPPKSIKVETNSNMANIWTQKGKNVSTIYYYSLSSTNYDSNGKLDFGISNLLSSEVESYTNLLKEELKGYNTYSIEKVLTSNPVPAFIGKDSFNVTSSNSQILSVEKVNGIRKLVAKGTGVVDLYISSSYNTKLTEKVTVNVVNAINNSELSYYTSGNKNIVKSNSEIVVSKSTPSNQQTFILNNSLVGKFDFAFGKGSKTFDLNQNNASGIRYYYVADKTFTINNENVNGYSLLHENALTDSGALPQITINNKTFTQEWLQVEDSKTTIKNYYVYYIDVPTGSTTNIIGLNESNTKLLAVPYFVSVDELGNAVNTPLINITSYNVVNSITYNYKSTNGYVLINNVPVAGIADHRIDGYDEDGNENIIEESIIKLSENAREIDIKDYINNFVTLFNVKVVNSSYSVKTSVNNVNFFVQQPISFYVDIKTDNKNAILYLTYYGNSGEERTIAVSKVVGGNLEREMNPLTISGLTLSLASIDYSSFDNADVTEKYVRYYFNLEVKDEDKLDIQDVVSKTYNFFIVKDNVSVNYDPTNSFVVSDLSEITLSSSSVNVTLNPQEIVNISLKHYPKGEANTEVNENGEQTTIFDLGEEAYDNIIPGFTGVLKINISPVFANFDEVVLTSSTSQGSVVWFNQVLANMALNSNGEYVYDGSYSTISGSHDILGRIVLTKQSNKLANGNINFDGFIYVKTLINSFVNESGEFTLTAQAYKNGVALKSQSITLSVKTTPTLNLHVNGRDSAAVARGTSLSFSADHEGIEGEVDFSGSYAYRIINGVESVLGGYGTFFDISKQGNNYVLDTNLTLNSQAYICVKGTIRKEINGEIYEKSDVLRIKVSDFVIESIGVENVTNGNFVGLFNQTYGLVLRITNYTCHPSLQTIVEGQVKELEKQFSSVDNKLSESGAWYTGSEQNHGTIKLGTNPTETFVFSKMSSTDLDNETVYSIRNIRFNSGDRLLARAMYCYTDEGIKPILDTDMYHLYESNEFTYDRYFEFGFGFYRVRTEDNPDPIATVEEFKAMESGVDYILVNDLELNDWEPFSADLNINSLDGNGYVITINSFKLDAKPDNDAALIDKTFGIFTQINSETVIKNLIIEVKPNKSISINNEAADKTSVNGDLNIDATAYKNITFGLLAGVNYGMVTNVQVTNNADWLKYERELIIARASADNPDYAKYWSSGNFDELKFAADVAGKYNYIVDEDKTTDEKIIYKNQENIGRDLSIVKVNTTITTDSQEHYMGVLVGKNDVSSTSTGNAMGYITNSSVDNITINGIGYVGGFAAYNAGKISTSYYKGANIINRAGESDSKNSATSGFVVFNTGSNASIQYSYVEGRLGDGDNFQLSVDEKFITKANSDKTGLTDSMKSGYAGYAYNENAKNNADFNYNIAGLRAMNSAISSATEASAFVYENNANISNSYANILVKSSMKTSGFVFSNKEAGTINSCFTLSSVLVNNMDASPFTGRNSQYDYNNVTPNSITDCHYLKLGSSSTDSDSEKEYKDVFLDEGELATGIGAGDFDEYNTFQSFAFNTDFNLNSEQEVIRSVWFIPTRGTDAIYEANFKHNFYSLSRPQLVAANLKTQSIRVWAGTDSSDENKYNYVSTVIGEDISNPILVKSAENFNSYLNYESSINDDERNFAIRLISDIAFNKTDLTARTYNMEYYGDLDGNGMNISELRLIADKDFESQNKTVEYLGLFGRIITKDKDTAKEQRGVVRNLNINVSEVKGSDVTFVGALAGQIENANVFNINITGDEVIQGRNVVGGLAGLVSGDSEIVNISSSLSAKAAYYKYPNLFKATNSLLDDSSYGSYEIFNKTEDNGVVSIKNAKTISYAGGIIGIFDVDARPSDEQNKRSLFNAKARSLEVSGNVTLVGEVVGGVFGAIGVDSTASEISFIVSDNAEPELIASRVAGGVVGENRGSLERALISQTLETQKKIDNEYKASATGTGYKIINKGYSDLFSGNAHFIGGLVGFNNGGQITNSYSKVNVSNIDSLYAGGVAGLNTGGKIAYVYTTSSVNAFRGVGGFIGLHTEAPVTLDDNKQLSFKEEIIKFLFLDTKSGNVEAHILPNSNTTISNIVAANVWREEDLYTDRSLLYNNTALKIGAIFGNIIMNKGSGDNINPKPNAYNLSKAFANFSPAGSRKLGNETIYFVQPLINRPLGTVLGTGTTAKNNEKLLMPEIGAIGNSKEINDLDSSSEYIDGDARIKDNLISYAGFSDVEKTKDNSGNVAECFYYSRMQNIGSARTMLEVFETKLNATDATVWGDNEISKPENLGYVNDAKGLFANWSSDYWTGLRKTSDGDDEVTPDDIATAFPYLEPKAIKSRVLVYNANQLAQMEDYKNAEFILQNDIDLSILKNWQAVGTQSDPFEGSIHSQSKPDGGYYNFKIYDSKKTVNFLPSSDFLGLLGVVNDASFHHFTLEDLTFTNSAVYAGSLFALAQSKATVNEVVANKITMQLEACTVGGLIGYGGGTKITNSLVKKSTITVNKFTDTNIDVNNDKLVSYSTSYRNSLYGFGGVAGMIDSDESEIVLANGVELNDVSITIGNSSNILNGILKNKNEYAKNLSIGGAFGVVNPRGMSNLGIAGINATKVQINANIKPNDSFNNISVGGLVGYTNSASLTSYVGEQENEDGSVSNTYVFGNSIKDASHINVNVSNNYKYVLNVGGAVGALGGDINVLGLENILVESSTDNSFITVNNTTGGDTAETNIGGVAGKVNNFDIRNLTTNFNSIKVDINGISKTTVGGLVGVASNCSNISNSLADINSINVEPSESTTSKLTSVGGAIGIVDMHYDLTNITPVIGKVNRVVANVDLIKSTSKNTPSRGIKTTKNIGGLIGTIYNGEISESVSNSNIEINGKGYPEYIRYNLGGLVGVADIDYANKVSNSDLNKNYSKVLIQNNYTTGYIQDEAVLIGPQTNDGLIIGSINYAYKTRDVVGISSLFEMYNNYSIGNYVGDYVYFSTKKGGVVGGITTTDSANYNQTSDSYNSYKNSTNIKLIENYYNQDFVPYSNNFGTALNTEQMLFGSSNTFKSDLKVWSKEYWNISDNSYPLLKWIEEGITDKLGTEVKGVEFKNESDGNSIGQITSGYVVNENIDELNLINFKRVADLQASGLKVKPANGIADAISSIFTSNYTGGNIAGKTYYFKNGAGLGASVTTVDNKSILYGLTTTGFKIKENEGFITKVNTKDGNSLIAGTNSHNAGIIFNVDGSGFAIANNTGLIDTLKSNAAITNDSSGIINNASIVGNIINNYDGIVKNSLTTSGANNKTIKIYSDNGTCNEFTVDDKNNVTHSVSKYNNNNGKFNLSYFLKENGNQFDFDKIWTIIIPDQETANQTKFRFGLPMLQIDLKSDLRNERMDDEYYWANDNIVNETNTGSNNYAKLNNYDYYLKNIYNSSSILIREEEDLAAVAAYSNYGYKVVDISNAEVSLNDYYRETVSGYGIGLTTEKYEFGLKIKTTHNLLNYNNIVLTLPAVTDPSKEVSLNFYNKLWTPIGFGADNISDENLVTGSGNNAKYLKSSIVGEGSYSNLFAGKISGNKYSFVGLSAIGVNRNVGLFGSVEVPKDTAIDESQNFADTFANDILIKDSNFISVSKNNGISSTGTLAGFVYVNKSQQTYFTSKVGVENSNIYATQTASGLIGKVTFANTSNNKLIIYKVYVNSSVYGNNTSGLAYTYCGGTSATNNAVFADQVYYIGELSGKVKLTLQSSVSTTNPYSKNSLFMGNENTQAKSNNVYAVDYYDQNAMLSTIITSVGTCNQVITIVKLGTGMLDGFDWISTWVRTMPGEYPTFSTKVEYWIKNYIRPDEDIGEIKDGTTVVKFTPGTINKSTKTITINPHPYKFMVETVNNIDRKTPVYGPQQLAWIAYVVNNGGVDEQGYDYDNFNGWTIKINGSMNFGGMVWTPIGYYSSLSDNEAFKGILIGNGDIRLENVMSTSVYAIDDTNTITGVEALTNDSLGLVGYAVNATIQNLTVESGIIYGGENIGTIVGYAVDTSIINCANGNPEHPEEDKTFVGGYSNVGGIVGYYRNNKTEPLNISTNTNRAAVQYSANYKEDTDKPENFGGIAGLVYGNVIIKDDYNIKTVRGNINVGGLVGKIINGVTVDCSGNLNSNNTGDVSGYDNVGGIVGYVADNKSIITSVTNSGKIIGYNSAYVGGIAGTTNGNITLAVNNGSVSADNSAGIVAKIENTDVYINNVLNTAAATNGIAYSLPNGFDASMFGLCVTTSGNPLGAINLAKPYTAVFNSVNSYTSTAFSYGDDSNKINVTYKNIIEQNPYWSYGSNITLNYSYKATSLTMTPPSIVNGQFRIDTEAKFNYVNFLIKTNFMNSSTSKVIKPIYLQTLSLSNGFKTLASNTAYPIKVEVTGTSVSVASGNNGAKSILGYAYNNTIQNITFVNNGSNTSNRFDDGVGALLIAGHNVKLNNINAGNDTTIYYPNNNFGTLAANLFNSEVVSCISKGFILSYNSSNIGGLIGNTFDNTRISKCTNTAYINYEPKNGNFTNPSRVSSSTGTNIGGIVGAANDTTIGYEGTTANKNCSNTQNIFAGSNIGGIVGYATNNSKISANNSAKNIRGTNYVGGIVGKINHSSINNSINTGRVEVSSSYVGGITGYAENSSEVVGNTNNFIVVGNDAVGGIVGYSSYSKINSNTADTNSVAGALSYDLSYGCGGIVGYATYGELNNNLSKGFGGYVSSYDSMYLTYNMDSYDGYSSRTASDVYSGYRIGYYNGFSGPFKFGTIFGNLDSRDNGFYLKPYTDKNNNQSNNAKSTKFVDQYTEYYGKGNADSVGGFTGKQCGVRYYSRIANPNGNGEGEIYNESATMFKGGYNLSTKDDLTLQNMCYSGGFLWIGGDYGFTVSLGRSTNYIGSDSEPFPGVKSYTVKYFDSVNPNAVQTKRVVEGGTAVYISDVYRSKYELVGWKTSDGLEYDFSKPVTGDLNLYAIWQRAGVYVVKFDLQGGTGNIPDQTLDEGDNVPEPNNPTKPGLSFGGWYTMPYGEAYKYYENNKNNDITDADGKPVNSFNDFWKIVKFDFKKYEINANITIYAHWSQAVVTFMNDSTDDAGVFLTQKVNFGGVISEPASSPTKPSMAFQHWAIKDGDNFIMYNWNTPINSDLILYPVFSSSVVNVTYYKEDGVTIDKNYGTNGVLVLSKGAKLDLPTMPTKPSYKFDGWYTKSYSQYLASGDTKPYSTYKITFPLTVNADISIYQYFVTIPFTVRFVDEEGILLSDVPNQIVHTGGNVSRPTDPVKEGYNFVGWFTTATGNEQFIFSGNEDAFVVMDHINIYAHFEIKTFSVTFVDANGTKIDEEDFGMANPIIVDWNSTVINPGEIANPADTSMLFRGWYSERKNNSLSGFDYDKLLFDFENTKITSNIFIYGYWEPADTTYTVSFVDSLGNSLTGDAFISQKVGFGQSAIRPTDNPVDPSDSENTFNNWYIRNSEGEFVLFDFEQTKIRNDLIIYALWDKPVYNVTFVDIDGMPFPSEIIIQVKKGDKIDITQYPELQAPPIPEGKTFVGWYKIMYDPGFTGNYDDYIFNFDNEEITSDLVLYAYYE